MDFKMTPEQIQQDRIVSSYLRAQAALRDAASAIQARLPHGAATIATLKKAQDELDWYLSEVEKAGG
jgi:cell fate (sporulation/competence/biofilm development) regulator YlbF (YheA/YmcA/DUF963 family)